MQFKKEWQVRDVVNKAEEEVGRLADGSCLQKLGQLTKI